METDKKTVLVIDDDTDMNTMICDALEQAGFFPLQAFNGQEALDHHEIYSPDAVLLDIMLPDMQGTEVCRALKARPGKSIIIMVSARTDSSSKLSSYLSGARRYVTKPFNLDDLVKTLTVELRQREYTRMQHQDETA
jgi:DNA-binding response OmpR family regulator